MTTAKTIPTAQQVADAFVAVLREWIKDPRHWDGAYSECTTAEQAWALMCATNAKADPGICASHDWCDANMAMGAAFEQFGIDPCPDDGSAMQEVVTNLWNEAWDLAMPALGGKTKAQFQQECAA